MSISGPYPDFTPPPHLLERIYETMRDGVCGFDPQGRIVFCNPAMALLVGRPIEALIGRTPAEAWNARKSEGAGGSRSSSSAVEWEIVLPDGRRRYAMAKSFDLTTTPPIVVSIFRDVTERRRHQRVNDAIGRLGVGLAAAETMDRIIALVDDAVRALLLCDAFYFAEFDPTRLSLHILRLTDVIDGRIQEFEAPEISFERIGASVREALKGDLVVLNRKPGNPDSQGGVLFPGTKRLSASLLFVPIVSGEQTLGVLSAQSYRPEAFSEPDAVLLKRIADIAAPAINRVRALQALQESEERYSLVIRGANDGLWDWNLLTGIVHYSDRWCDLMGLTGKAVTRSPEEWFDRIHPEDLPTVKDALKAHLDGRTEHFEVEHRILLPDGTQRWVGCRGLAYRAPDGRPLRFAGSAHDITERKEAEERLIRSAFYDELTGLANRALFMEHLQHALNSCRRNHDHQFAVLFLDCDRFKVINDSLGHIVGDRFLVALANRLARAVRPDDIVARLGGDEFTVLLDDLRNSEDAIIVAERIQEALLAAFDVEGNHVYSSVSIGIAYGSASYEKAEDILRDADTAMYRAKLLGRARHVVFDARMRTEVQQSLRLETDLHRAIERQEFEVVYEPIICLRTGQLCGFESLLRWVHPENGRTLPEVFIPFLEETGLITKLGHWGMRNSCRQAAQWQAVFSSRLPRPLVTMNLSSREFAQPDLLRRLDEIMVESSVDTSQIVIEITESTLMGDYTLVNEQLEGIKARGFLLGIDDFGTGYSSLSYLHRLPIDILKIDRSFVLAAVSSAESREIVKTIVALARNLKVKVVAEGIETREHLEQVKAFNCNYAQGYFFSPPVSSEEATEMLVSGRSWKLS
ncbi:MAG: EAL domain-containing protein [Candidatus Sumerlaeaceae bacterium]|nr:EAL domain-containing protein [Candidatus Sumerlaeaceae bacterium]